ncbi:MAG: tail fiber domain-containing protein, partial [Bacteroidota bacterium]
SVVDLSPYRQDLTLSNNILSLTNDPSVVDLSPYLSPWQSSNGSLFRTNGKIGVGTNTPVGKLGIATATGDGLATPSDGLTFQRTFSGGFTHAAIYSEGSAGFNGSLVFATDGDGVQGDNPTEKMRIASNGNVGIGTNNPYRAKLEIAGFVNFDVGAFGWLNGDGDTNFANGGLSYNYSIYASNRIAATEFNAFSDTRIKKVLGQSNPQADLATLMAIEITDYQHIDTIQHGQKWNKKVIAQQVAEVFPQAVTNNTTEVIPDIYQRASLQDGWIQLSTELQVGDRIKIITTNSNDIHEVTALEPGRFKVSNLAEEDQETVFVFGREVNDFHTVDYEAISMLNVSATQAQQERIEALEAENTQLTGRIDQLETALNNIATQLQQTNNHHNHLAESQQKQ